MRKMQESSKFGQAYMQKLAYFGEKVKELTMIEKDIKKIPRYTRIVEKNIFERCYENEI